MLPSPRSVPLAEGPSFRDRLLAGCEAYASVPATLLYSPNYATGSGGLSVLGKLPLRLYIGAREVHGEGEVLVRCAETYTFSPEDKSYQLLEREPVRAALLTQIAKRLGVSAAVELTIWSDFPFWRGLHADASVATAAAAVLAILGCDDRSAGAEHLSQVARAGDAEALRWRSVERGPAFPEADTNGMQSLAARVFEAAILLESQMFHAPADGHFVLASLLDSERALVFARKPDTAEDIGSFDAHRWFRDNTWWGSQIEELWPEKTVGLWPVAVALWFVSQGNPADPRGILRESSFDPHVMPLEQLFGRADRPIYGLERDHTEPAGRALLRAYRQACVACSVRVMQTLKRALTDGSARVAPFCDSQDRCQGLLRLLERSPVAAQREITQLATAAAHHSVSIGARFQEYGRHGYLLVVGEPVRLREVMAAAEQSAGRHAMHWYYEPHQLAARGLEVQLGHVETVDFRLLSAGTWRRTPSMPRAHLARQRLHLLVRVDPAAEQGAVAWCCRIDGSPNRNGDTYEALAQALSSGEMPDPKDVNELSLQSLPTLALVLACLSETEGHEVALAETNTRHYRIPIRSRDSREVVHNRDRTSISHALQSGNALLQATAGCKLHARKKRKAKGTSHLTVLIEPDADLIIGVELVRG